MANISNLEKESQQDFLKPKYGTVRPSKVLQRHNSNFAMLYQHGRGVPTDYKKALYYYMLGYGTNDPLTTSDFYMHKVEE